LSLVAEAQRQGGRAVFFDVEHALDLVMPKSSAINVEDLIISHPKAVERAQYRGTALIRSGAIDVIVVDSVAALVSKASSQGQMGTATVGAQARLMSQAMRRLTRRDCQKPVRLSFHQPDTRKNRGHVWLARNPAPEVARLNFSPRCASTIVGSSKSGTPPARPWEIARA
jgi:hypothetical protein